MNNTPLSGYPGQIVEKSPKRVSPSMASKILLVASLLCTVGGVAYTEHRQALQRLQNQLDLLTDQNQTMSDLLSVVFQEPFDLERLRMDEVTATAYSSTIAECDQAPHETASGSTVATNCIATSRDLPIPFDKVILASGIGSLRNEDTMGRYKGKARVPIRKAIDLWMPDTTAAKAFGVRPGVTIFWLEEQP